MELQKIISGIAENIKHWQLPLFAGLTNVANLKRKEGLEDNDSGLGEIAGDNILPKEILISLSSRRELRGRY